jgi:4-amino-4-deoxychorismate lyase
MKQWYKARMIETTLSTQDRGLLYGDGLFTTIAVADSRPLLWERHWQRLRDGCRRLAIALPARQEIERGLADTCADQRRGVAKCIITRGVGGRGYRPLPQLKPSVLWRRHAWPDYPAAYFHDGVALRLCRLRLGQNPALAGIKHLNRLENVLARGEWDEAGIAEGILRDSSGYVVGGVMSNLFCSRAGVLYTPELSRCGVAGVMRAALLELARAEGMEIQIQRLRLRDLARADEVFISNSLLGLWPARRLGRWQWPVGAISRRLQTGLLQRGWMIGYG